MSVRRFGACLMIGLAIAWILIIAGVRIPHFGPPAPAVPTSTTTGTIIWGST